MIRLLPKSEVNRRKAEEQRQAIEEGLKVAERIDTLRETLATEETAFDSYRTTSLKEIQNEIQEKHQEKSTLASEVIKLRREKTELLEPLDAKWEEVNRLQKVCTDWQEELRNKNTSIANKESSLSARERDVEVKEGKALDLQKLASAMFAQAENTVFKAKEEAADVHNKSHAELALTEVQKYEVAKRESAVQLQQGLLEEKEARIEKYEIDLAKREQTLRAGWRNLERTKQKILEK